MSGGGSSSSTTRIVYPKFEQEMRDAIMARGQEIYNSSGQAPFPGVAPVGPSADTQAAQTQMRNYATSLQGLPQQTQQALDFGLNGVLQPNENLGAYINAAVRPIMQSYTDPGGAFSQIRSGATEAGQFGSSRQGIAEGVATGRLANAVGDTTAKIVNEAYGQGLDTFGRTMALAPQMVQLGQAPASMLSAIGAQTEQYANQQNDFQTQQNLWDVNAPWDQLANWSNIVYGGATPSTRATTPSASNGAAIGGATAFGLGAIPGIAGAGGLAGGMAALTGPLGMGLMALGSLF